MTGGATADGAEQGHRDAGPPGAGRVANPSASALCAAAVRLLPVQGASIATMTTASSFALVASSGPVAARLAELHLDLGEGPALDAYRRGHPVVVPDLQREPVTRRWPIFADAAVGMGVAALAALPLRIGVISLGAMLLHRDDPGGLSATELAQALRLADAAAYAVLDASAEAETDDESGGVDVDIYLEQLGGATQLVGAEVHQASGMVMVQLGIPIVDALARLRAHAFAEGRSVSEVARDVVARKVRFEK